MSQSCKLSGITSITVSSGFRKKDLKVYIAKEIMCIFFHSCTQMFAHTMAHIWLLTARPAMLFTPSVTPVAMLGKRPRYAREENGYPCTSSLVKLDAAKQWAKLSLQVLVKFFSTSWIFYCYTAFENISSCLLKKIPVFFLSSLFTHHYEINVRRHKWQFKLWHNCLQLLW